MLETLETIVLLWGFTIVVTILYGLTLSLYYLLLRWRNNQVFRLQMEISQLKTAWDERHLTYIEEIHLSAFRWCKTPTYPEMLYSFKRLKLENWVKSEDLRKLMS